MSAAGLLVATFRHIGSRMASPEVISRLEKRAVQAEQIIGLLTKQIGQLQAVTVDSGKEQLRQENEELRQEVEVLKKALVDLEKGQGIPQYYDFSKKTSLSVGSQPEAPATAPVAAPAPTPAPVQAQEQTGKKTEKKEKKKDTEKKEKKGGGGGGKVEEAPVDVSRLDFRVGRIVSAKCHPDADSLYVEEVDVGEEKPRTVVSGLVKFVPLEQMQNRMAVLLCNLKPAKMRGVTSEAMVMCASTPEKVEILIPPEGSQPGDLVEFEGYPRKPDSVLNPKKKIFETCAPDLKTNGDKTAVYKGVAFSVPGKGLVVAPSLTNVQVK